MELVPNMQCNVANLRHFCDFVVFMLKLVLFETW